MAVPLRGSIPCPAAVPRPDLTASTTLEVPVPGPYKKAKIAAGRGGWGGPLTIEPTEKKPLIYCVTGGGIHPVAQKIADITGGEVFDGFKSSAPFDKIAVAVIDCGGTARVGVYPMKKVPTVDIHATSPAGPLSMFITADLFVSGVKPDNITEA
ncbi:MAG TPA: hypothetical protein VHN80_11130 [Kineosporiaceae bacterium]|nr:hypothetical protein [Kineosporiaceae bacterium]